MQSLQCVIFKSLPRNSIREAEKSKILKISLGFFKIATKMAVNFCLFPCMLMYKEKSLAFLLWALQIFGDNFY